MKNNANICLSVLCLWLAIKECHSISLVESSQTKRPAGDTAAHNGIGSTSLAIIIGSIVTSFVIVLLLQWLIKKYICKRKDPDSGTTCNNATASTSSSYEGSSRASIPEVIVAPPSYDDIHLYKQLDLSAATPLYYTIPGAKNYYGIILKASTSEDEDESVTDPPSYEEEETSEV